MTPIVRWARRSRDVNSPIAWLRCQLQGLRHTGSPQRIITALTGREHLWWECCHEAAHHDPTWFDDSDTELVREWVTQAAADDGSRQAARLYLDSAFKVARAATGTPGSSLVDSDRDGLSRQWEATGLMVPSSSQTGQAMIAVVELMLTGLGPRRRPVTIPVLFGLADEHGEVGAGSAGLLELRELPDGPAGLFPDPRVLVPTRGNGSAFVRSLANAWSTAPRRCKERCVIWRIVLPDDPTRLATLEGGSLGAAFAIGLRELCRYPTILRVGLGWLLRSFYGLRPRTAITGVVDADQRLGYVTGMSAKLGTAYRKRWLVIAPSANRLDRVQAPDPTMVRFAGTVRQADRYARRWRMGRLATAAGLATVSAVVGTFAAHQASADAARRQAAVQASASLGGYLVSQMNSSSFDSSQFATDALLAVDAYRTAPTPQAIQALFDTYAEMSPYQAIIGTYAGTTDTGTTPDTSLSVNRSGTVVVVPHDTTAEVWEVPHDLSSRHLIGIINGVTAALVSPDGTHIGAVGSDGELQLWTTTPLRLRSQVQLPATAFAPPNGGADLAFDASTRYLAVAGQFSPFIWDLGSNRLKEMAVPTLADQSVDEIGFLNEDTAYDVQQNGARFFWDLATGGQIPAPQNSAGPILDSLGVTVRCANSTWHFDYTVTGGPVAGMPSGLPCTGKASPAALNGHFFVTVLPTGTDYSSQLATVIDLRTQRAVAEAGLSSNVHVAGIDPSGQRLFVRGSPGGIARLWPPIESNSAYDVSAQATSPDGRLIAQPVFPGSMPGPRVKILSVKSGKELRVLTMPIGNYVPNSLSDADVTTDVFLSNGRLLVLAAGIVTLWDAENGIMTSPPMMLGSVSGNSAAAPNQSPPDVIIAADPAHSGEISMTGPGKNTLEIWQTTGWHHIRTIGPLSGVAESVEFSPDGTSIGAMTQNGTADVFDAKNGSAIAVISAPGTGFSPILSLLKSGYLELVDSNDIYLWRRSTQVAHIAAPAATTFDSSETGIDGGQQLIDIVPSADNTALSTPHPFYLVPNPSLWADRICAAVNRRLTSQELSIPGPSTPNNGC